MKFTPPLATAYFVRRYKRFLLDVLTEDGKELTMHCPNTGSMKNCGEQGDRIWYSRSENKARKYPHTFELVEVSSGAMIGINTSRANALVKEGIENKLITELEGYQRILSEVKYGEESSRIDFLLQKNVKKQTESCYVEVKSVTLNSEGDVGLFPDSVTSRGLKHLRELMYVKAQGHRAVLLFCVQHSGINSVQPADQIDPQYALGLQEAAKAGVELLAYKARISKQELNLEKALPVILPPLL